MGTIVPRLAGVPLAAETGHGAPLVGQRLRSVGLPLVLVVGAAVLWGLSLRAVDVGRMSDLGLVSVLPISTFVALVALTVGFCLALRRSEPNELVLLVHVAALILMLYGIASVVEETPRLHVSWRHVGIVELIVRSGEVDPLIDAYFNWPGFFVLAAFVGEIAGVPSGIESALGFVTWVPIALNLATLGPLLVILRTATDDRRLAWLAVWFFYSANWIGQDYYSPQGVNFILHLVVLAVLLKWFNTSPAGWGPVMRWRTGFHPLAYLPRRVHGWMAAPDLAPAASSAGHRFGLLAIVVVIYGLEVVSHQLTPFATLASVVALVLFNRCGARALPVLMAIMIALWFRYGAAAYIAGFGDKLVAQMGDVGSAVDANTTARFEGSEAHLFVVYMRSAMTVAVWGLALLGGLRRLGHRRRDVSMALLAAATLPLIVLQPYGGEILMRVYLFTLPFMAFFAAALFYTKPIVGTSWFTTVVVGAVSLALVGGFFITRYGNERMDHYTMQEVDAVERLYRVADHGSLLVAAAHQVPWDYQDYELYRSKYLLDEALYGDVDAVADLMGEDRCRDAYLILTRAQAAFGELFAGVSPAAWAGFEREVAASDRFRPIYANPDATIFQLTRDASPAGTACLRLRDGP